MLICAFQFCFKYKIPTLTKPTLINAHRVLCNFRLEAISLENDYIQHRWVFHLSIFNVCIKQKRTELCKYCSLLDKGCVVLP